MDLSINFETVSDIGEMMMDLEKLSTLSHLSARANREKSRRVVLRHLKSCNQGPRNSTGSPLSRSIRSISERIHKSLPSTAQSTRIKELSVSDKFANCNILNSNGKNWSAPWSESIARGDTKPKHIVVEDGAYRWRQLSLRTTSIFA